MSDGSALVSQLDWMVATEPPPASIVALFFGIFSAVGPGDRTFPQLYVMGSTSYGEEDSDWACQVADSWLPTTRYFKLPGLASMDPDEWEFVLEAVRELIAGVQPEITRLLGTPAGRPVVVGWDDGDMHKAFVAQK